MGVAFNGEEAENLEEKSCCVFVVDTSGSMGADALGSASNRPIEQLNAGLQQFVEEIRNWDLVRHRLEVVVVEFNSSVRTVLEPTLGINLPDFQPLSATGSTKLVDGVLRGIEIAKVRTAWYDETGQPRKRPWVILITDGGPDSDQDVARLEREIREGESSKSFVFLPIGVDGARMEFLEQIAMKNHDLRPRLMSNTKFSEFFRWVSELFSKVMQSKKGEKFAPPQAASWQHGIDL